ncbi:MAG: DUF4346 domain-containing protein [Promethearchaeota archaeon]
MMHKNKNIISNNKNIISNISDKLKILILTGNQSFAEIYKIAELINNKKNLNIICDVKKIDVSVSAFINEHHIIKLWNSLEVSEKDSYSFMILPGFTPWDATNLSKKLNIPIYKGTRFASDLSELLLQIRNITLSHKKAADLILKKNSLEKMQKHILNLRKKYDSGNLYDLKENYLIFENSDGENIYISSEFPPLLFAEIVNAPKLNKNDVLKIVEYYINSGADVIDIGTIYGKNEKIRNNNIQFIREIIPMIKQKYDVFVSIDSVDIDEIIAGIESGTDFILSLDGGNINEFIHYAKYNKCSRDLGLILVPLVGKDHKPLGNADEKADFLIEMAIKLYKNNFLNVFYDMLLQTPIKPGIIDSLYDYILLYDRINAIRGVKYPLFMGFNNVFELIDADSSGIAMLLSTIATELDVGGILTTEYSNKSLGNILETRKAIDLAYLAKISKTPPINLGMDAFFAKNKNKNLENKENPFEVINLEKPDKNYNLSKDLIIRLNQKKETKMDKMGFFKIYTNHKNKTIEVMFYPSNFAKKELNIKGPMLIIGKDAQNIFDSIQKLELISNLNHAFYLGKELSKAEIALKIHANFQEDI